MSTSVLQAKKELVLLLAEKERRLKYDKFRFYFFQNYQLDAKTGLDISREKYPAHMSFMAATKDFKELAFIAPNRSGKSEAGAFILTCLLTGEYPEWWEGKRFPPEEPLELLAFGKTHVATRDVAQQKLIGNLFDPGTGMIPKEYIHEMRKKPGSPGALLDLYVKNKVGTINHLQFLSYEIEEDVVMGRNCHAAWFDEECLNTPLYNEVLMRTMTTNGFVFSTYTPLDGFTEGIQKFAPELVFPDDGVVRDKSGKSKGMFVKHCGWNSAPHLTESAKEDMRTRYHGAELIARTEGLPTVGSGQVYPYTQDQITCDPFPIPAWWPRAYGLDFGWDGEAVIWLTQDPETKVMYAYSEYYAHQKPSHQKIADIRERISALGDPNGEWMWGAADPSGGGRSADGLLTLDYYIQKGLNLQPANNSLALINRIQGMFETGMLKIFKGNCPTLVKQLAVYKYDDKDPKPAKRQQDHAPDAMRYGISVFEIVSNIKPDPDEEESIITYTRNHNRSPVTGY